MTLKDEQARNDIIIDCLNETAIISETDVNGNITRVNNLFEKISGYSKEELIGKNHSLVNSGHHTEDFFKNMWRVIKSGLIWQGEILNKKKNGDYYWVDSTIFAVYDSLEEIVGFMSIRYDITEKIRMKEAELAQYRLKSIGESAAQTMHDIMNPLTIIQHGLNAIHRQANTAEQLSSEDLLRKVIRMETACTRIAGIVRNMQLLMHGSYEKQEVSLVSEINASKEYLNDKLQQKNVTFSFVYNDKEEDYSIQANGLQIQQVVINLVNNSIDAIENFDERWIRLELSRNHQGITLSVIDSGKGIDLKIQDKIFDSMFSTKEIYKGSGLGLGICKKIVESFGGSIKINNNSHYTRFDVEFPDQK